jgi:hypothetical protein
LENNNMSHINDNILAATGGPTVNDGLVDWYGQLNGSINDAENLWLKQRPYPITSAHSNDMWYQFLRADGYTGALSDMLAQYWAAPSRVIANFTGSQYGTLDTAITFTGDFEVEAPVAIPDETASAFQVIAGHTISSNGFMSAMNTGQIRFSIASTVSTFSPVSVTPYDGKIHSWKLTRVGSVGTLFIDGILQSTIAVPTTNSVWDTIGSHIAGSNIFNGQILSVKFTDQSGSEDVVTNYVFDSGSTTVQEPRGGVVNDCVLTNFTSANWSRYTLQRNIAHDAGVVASGWVGADLVINGGFDADSDWTKGDGWSIGSGVASVDGSQAAASAIFQSGDIDAGSLYLCKGDVLNDSMSYRITLGGGTAQPSPFINTSTSYSVVATAGSSNTNMNHFVGSAGVGSIDNVSVQHLLEIS